jgi:hypothetical protein
LGLTVAGMQSRSTSSRVMMTCIRCRSIPQARELRRPNQGISGDSDVGWEPLLPAAHGDTRRGKLSARL